MSYFPTGLTDDQARSIESSLNMSSINSLPDAEKIDILLRHKEIAAQRRMAFWDAVSGFAQVAVPLATVLGIQALFGDKK